MSNEHLERIEAKIDRVITTQAEHTGALADHSLRLGGLDARVGAVEETLERVDRRVGAVEETLERVDRRVGAVEGTIKRLDTRVGAVEGTLERVDGRIGAVEVTLGRLDTRTAAVEVTLETNIPQAIMQIAEGHAMLQASMDRGFADMKKHIDERLAPFEEAVRQHSAILNTPTAGPQGSAPA